MNISNHVTDNKYAGDITLNGSSFGKGQKGLDESIVPNRIGMRLVLMSASGNLETIILPYPANGQFRFKSNVPVTMEAVSGKWFLRSLEDSTIISGEGAQNGYIGLYHRCLIPVNTYSDRYVFYAEDFNIQSNTYHNYMIPRGEVISIGRSEENDIVYPVHVVSRHHATLTCFGKEWMVADCDSANGVFVNGKRVQKCMMKVGDEMQILGLRIVIGSGFISVNDGNDEIKTSGRKLQHADFSNIIRRNAISAKDNRKDTLFNRTPRHRMSMEPGEISIDSPPYAMSGDKIPFLMRMGSSAVMGGTAAMTGNVGILASMLLLPVLSQQYTKEDKEEYEKKRVQKYHDYLDEKWQEILREKKKEEAALIANYPPLMEVLTYTQQKKKLWERRNTDDDFLYLRLGSGKILLKAEIHSQKRSFDVERDTLLDELYDMTETQVYLENVPIILDLKKDYVCGINAGTTGAAVAFARDMIMRLSLLYSYDEVKIICLCDSTTARKLEFVSYLPHIWDDQRSIRFLATDIPEACQIGEYIRKSLDQDIDGTRPFNEMIKSHPYYIVFAFNRRLFESMEVLKDILSSEENRCVSVIATYEDLPKECSVIVNLQSEKENEYTITYLKELDLEDQAFVPDYYDPNLARNSMRDLAGIRLKVLSQANSLPKTLTFLEMFRVGRIEHLDIARRWKESNPVLSLAVPIGVAPDGTSFMLDLHQKNQGPHGLVAGTTGSGKSEFLMTYILSLALNFHPDEVAFVLIDYKGGGLAGAFDDPANGIHLPHLLATITNLDGSAIARSLISIQSEMTRRQRVFNLAKSSSGEGTMDIYTYQRLYRNKKVNEPMPHLFIISDEFAELKQQQPDFLDSLVSIARIGRSLGVHLILATQKPAGVVTGQIVSNTKFRVCLKVQDKADSRDMLGRPEAADLKEAGRFYLQVGNNELFAIGQSGWSGAEYEPQEKVVRKRDESIRVIDNIGASLIETKPPKMKSGTGRSQLVELVRSICDIASKSGVKERYLWLPPLPDSIDIADLYDTKNSKYSDILSKESKIRQLGMISFKAGILDDPAKQAQRVLELPMDKPGGILISGEPGFGKTTFIQTMLYSLSSRYSPDEVNFYVLDYSSRLLGLFSNLPHCGAVLLEEHDNMLNAFFSLLDKIILERKKLFAELEVDNYQAACRTKQIPMVYVVIDNLAGMSNTKIKSAHKDMLPTYLKNCGNYGIRYIISANYLNEVPIRVRQNMTERIALHRKDKYDYTDALDCRVNYVPAEKRGRGLYVYDGNPLEMQLAMFQPGLADEARLDKLKKEISRIRNQYSEYQGAERLQIVSETQRYEDYCIGIEKGRIPLGYMVPQNKSILLPLKQFSIMSLYFGQRDSFVPVMSNFLFSAEREDSGIYFVTKKEGSVFHELDHAEKAIRFIGDETGILQLSKDLRTIFKERYQLFLDCCREHDIDANRSDAHALIYPYICQKIKPVFVFLERFGDLCDAVPKLTDEGILGVFSSFFLLADRCRIHFVGGFYSGDSSVYGNELFKCYNKAKLCILYGGMYSNQKLINVPYEYTKKENEVPYNRCLVHYRDQIHTLFMPCGERKEEVMPEDDRPIFA